MRWYSKFVVNFFTAIAILCFFFRFGQLPALPGQNKLQFELVWNMRKNSENSMVATVITERAYFMNIVSLYKAAADPHVRKLNIIMERDVYLRLTQAQEIVNVIAEFHKYGKEVIIWANGLSPYSQDIAYAPQFMVFAACDKRYFQSMNDYMQLQGLGLVREFHRKRLEKEKIDTMGCQQGDYKGVLAYEFMDGFDYYSAANRHAFLNDWMQQIRLSLVCSLNIDIVAVEKLFQQVFFSAQDMLDAKLIDGVQIYERQDNHVDLNEYVNRVKRRGKWCRNTVYVLTIGNVDRVGDMCKLLESTIICLAYNDAVKVVVLQMNSPGGSEELFRVEKALCLLRARGKYIIVLVDDTAASFGYYMSSVANKIITRPGALVGSIGVLSKLYDNARQLKEKGIERDQIYTHYPIYNPNQWIASVVSAACAKEFKNKVQARRKLSKEMIDDMAQGQWYSGQAGYKLGLVDSLTGYVGMLEVVKALFSGDMCFDIVFLPDVYEIDVAEKGLCN